MTIGKQLAELMEREEAARERIGLLTKEFTRLRNELVKIGKTRLRIRLRRHVGRDLQIPNQTSWIDERVCGKPCRLLKVVPRYSLVEIEGKQWKIPNDRLESTIDSEANENAAASA